MNAEFNELLRHMAVRLEGAGMQRGKMMGKCEGCGVSMPMEAKTAGNGEMLCEMCQKKAESRQHRGQTRIAEGLEQGVKKVLHKAGFDGDFHFENGLVAYDSKTAEAIVKALNKSGEFSLAKVGRKEDGLIHIDFGSDESVEAEGTGVEEAKKPKLGSGKRFKNLVKALDQRDDVEDSEALAAWVGMQKYGKAKFMKMAAAGRKRAGK